MSHVNNCAKGIHAVVQNQTDIMLHFTPCLCVSYILSLLPNIIIINAKSLKDYRRHENVLILKLKIIVTKMF